MTEDAIGDFDVFHGPDGKEISKLSYCDGVYYFDKGKRYLHSCDYAKDLELCKSPGCVGSFRHLFSHELSTMTLIKWVSNNKKPLLLQILNELFVSIWDSDLNIIGVPFKFASFKYGLPNEKLAFAMVKCNKCNEETDFHITH